MKRTTAVSRHASIMATTVVPAPGWLALLALALFGMSGPVLGQERDPRLQRDLPQAVTEPRRDLLILRSGGYAEGELAGCSATSCTFGGTSHPRDDVALIGLGIAGSDPPPAIDDPLQDSIHLRSATVLKARLLGINAQAVVSSQGSQLRREVEWVYLAPPQPAPPGQAGRPVAPPEPGRPQDPASRNPGGPGSPAGTHQGPFADPGTQPPRPAPPGPDRSPQPGTLWVGTVHWSVKHTPTHLVTSTASVRLRETDVSDWSINLVHEGSSVSVMHSTLPGDDCTYTGHGASPAEGRAGWFERTQDVGPNGEKRRGAWTYELRIMPAREPVWTTTCALTGTGTTHTQTYGGNAGSTWQAAIGGIGGGAGYDPENDPQAARTLEGDRMSGRYTTPDPYGRVVAWSICRQGVACPPPPDPQPPDACGAPANQAALLDAALDQQKLLMDRFASKFDEYLRLADLARQYQSDFELAIHTCNRIGDLQTLFGLLMGQGPANVQRFAKSLGVIQKLLDGNTTFVIEDYVGERLKVQQIWATVMFALGKLGPASSTSPREQLMGCAGYNLDPVFEGALNFVQLTEQIAPLLPELNTLLNDQRNKDEEISSLWNDYHAACLEYAKCKGLPASSCEGLPAPR